MTRCWQDKIVPELRLWRERMDRLVGHTIVLTNGCFDLVHHGHVELLQAMKLLDDSTTLIVAVNSDESVRLLKGESRPLVPQHQRLSVVAALESVDYCFVFEDKRCDQVIRTVRPAIWAKGGDYTFTSLDPGERAAAKEVGAEIKIIPYTHGISTSEIIRHAQASPTL